MTDTQLIDYNNTLQTRWNAYKSVHPVTCRGAAKLADIDHRYLSMFSCLRSNLNWMNAMRLSKYLTERGF